MCRPVPARRPTPARGCAAPSPRGAEQRLAPPERPSAPFPLAPPLSLSLSCLAPRSEGVRDDFGGLATALPAARWHLNADVVRTHEAMVAARIFVGDSTSAFSRSVFLLRQGRALSYDVAELRKPPGARRRAPTPDTWQTDLRRVTAAAPPAAVPP